MQDKKISVILPIYNVEKYLDKCIESVVRQTYQNLEIILVDDGATDGCPQICDAWKARDNRIIVIHKQNAGLGFARNSGLDVATGEYVVFVDSDDWISDNMIECLYRTIVDEMADTVLCNFCRSYESGKTIEVRQKYINRVNSGEEVLKNVLFEMIGTEPNAAQDSYLYMSVWHGIYSLDLIQNNGIRFPSERQFISEDIIFDIDYFSVSRKTIFIDDCLYYYRENEKSLSSVYNPLRFDKEKVLYLELKRKMRETLSTYEINYRIDRMFLGRIRSCIMRSTVAKNINCYQEICKYCNDPVVRDVIKRYPISKNPIQQRIFNFCLRYRMIILLQLFAKIVAKKNLRG